ncbi:helix-turn-helix domain-containing protein [Nocardiopsis alba]|uniref:helix-turn-helix domain-containing protein n=1 Tax=Nocardiopsis alba TaxID=53437 RepID=UPI0034052B53
MGEYRRKRQRQFGQELKNLRSEAGMSGREAAELAGTDQSTISRVENGHIRPSHELLTRLLTTYGATAAIKEGLASELTELDVGVSSWRWLEERKGPRQIYVRDLEREALRRRGYHLDVIPGLLQTAAYAEKVIRASPTITPEQVSEGIALRMERQNILFEKQRSFSFVITEYALRRPFGTSETMRTQYERLLHLGTYPTIGLMVIPLWVPHPVLPHGFTIFDDSYVYIDTVTKPVNVIETPEVKSYISIYEDLVETALPETESLELIAALAKDTD